MTQNCINNKFKNLWQLLRVIFTFLSRNKNMENGSGFYNEYENFHKSCIYFTSLYHHHIVYECIMYLELWMDMLLV